jgi:hypothetical protein
MKTNRLFGLLLAFSSLAFAQQKYVGWSTGYLAGWAQGAYPPSQVVWKAYTHMCHFSATPQSGGLVKLAMGLNAQMATDFNKTAHANNVKTILCIGGAGSGSAFKSASSSSNRPVFIKSMVDLMTLYGYDGLDVDWEEGTGGADYIALHQELRAALDKINPRPLLTAAVAGYYSKDLGKVAQYCDQLNNMSYWTKAASIAGNMNQLVNMGIPKTKLGVGIGLDYEEGGNPEVDCDPVAAKAKAEFAVNNGYGGIMIWEIEKDLKKFGETQPVHAAFAAYVNKTTTLIKESRLQVLAASTLAPNRYDARGTRFAEAISPAAGVYLVTGSGSAKMFTISRPVARY